MSKLRTPFMIRSSSQTVLPAIAKNAENVDPVPAPSLKGWLSIGGGKVVLPGPGTNIGSKGRKASICVGNVMLTLGLGSAQFGDMVSRHVGNAHHVCPAPGEARLSPASRGAWLLLFRVSKGV